jgi:hypothetical protein
MVDTLLEHHLLGSRKRAWAHVVTGGDMMLISSVEVLVVLALVVLIMMSFWNQFLLLILALVMALS